MAWTGTVGTPSASSGGFNFGALYAAQAVSSMITSIMAGKVAKAEANYNASLLENKAKLIDLQKTFEHEKYNRIRGNFMAKSTVAVAGQGVTYSGSPIAAIHDSLTQINIDEIIGRLNLEQEKAYTMEESGAYKRAGKRAMSAGYSGAFQALLTGAEKTYQYNNKTSFDTDLGAKRAK